MSKSTKPQMLRVRCPRSPDTITIKITPKGKFVVSEVSPGYPPRKIYMCNSLEKVIFFLVRRYYEYGLATSSDKFKEAWAKKIANSIGRLI